MQTLLKSLAISALFFNSISIKAQKNIVISDSLLERADVYNIKLGGQAFGKLLKMEFGDYRILGSKVGGTTTTTRGNFWGTKSISNSKQKFSFSITNSLDTVEVLAAKYDTIKSTEELRVSPHFSIGGNEVKQWSQTFTAFMDVNNDTTNTWALLMNDAGLNMDAQYDGYLQNGQRKIVLMPVSSNKNKDDKRMVPALGFEFIENNKSIAAVQYYGGGLLGRNRNIAWIDKGLDGKTKLLLAAAITAIIQQKQMDM